MESSEKEGKRPLSLARPGRLELRKTIETGQVKQSFSHGRSKTVMVEVRKKRTYAPGLGDRMAEVKEGERGGQAEPGADDSAGSRIAAEARASIHTLTAEERAARARAVRGALATEEEETRRRGEQEAHRLARDDAQRLVDEVAAEEAGRGAEEKEPGGEQARRSDEEQRKRDEETRRKAGEESRRAGEEARRRTEEEVRRRTDERVATRLGEREEGAVAEEEAPRPGRGAVRRPPPVRRVEPRRRTGRLTVVEALREPDQDERVRSLAAVRRARERERLKTRLAADEAPAKVLRDVVIPETITVQELANRMAERSADVIRALMNMGVMATINHVIDADTAELVVAEFGHHHTRVAESDVEIGLTGVEDEATVLESRPPVVTIMGHVDHGKTTLLDALRETDVVSGEAGGITQHIGASQVTLESGRKITFIDTPGHEAFTAMRARGAKVTDIVVLVVAADDGVQPQTVEAINHARAAHVPIVLAINKMDRSEADPLRVRNDLLQHGIVCEQMGGDVQSIEVSATKRINLDKLEEAILLQAEVLELRANPNRAAVGAVIESKLEKGRGPVATVLVQRGTVRVGDIFVAGGEWGRVRALLDDRGNMIDSAGPSSPVEVIGLDGTPDAGDDFAVVDSESRARDVA
ncbi:MAG: translation initiation factor IF-2, partial [Alphaproteobacteria bacterium]